MPGTAVAERAASGRVEALHLTVPSQAERIASVRKTAREFAEHHRVYRPDDVALAISEACTNVVLHAYRDRPPGPLHLSGFVGAELVYLVVADDGSGLAPRPDSPGLGVGLTIIAQTTEHLRITEGAPTGTVVTMGFAHARVPNGPAIAADGGTPPERERLDDRVRQLERVLERLRRRARAADVSAAERNGLKRAAGEFAHELEQIQQRLSDPAWSGRMAAGPSPACRANAVTDRPGGVP